MTRLGYCTENDVYEATGLDSALIKNLSSKMKANITEMVEGFVAKADQEIKRKLGIPHTIRKEEHKFDDNETVELGPYEDSFEAFSSYEPENKVEEVYAIFATKRRIKLPYPKDCELGTESSDNWNAGSSTLTFDKTVFKSGIGAIKVVFAGADEIKYPDTGYYLRKKISPWTFCGFWFRASSTTVTFTLKIYDVDGNYMSHTFSVPVENQWILIPLKLADFTGYADMDLSNTFIECYGISADGACTMYFDNFNFNEGLFWTTPEGLICWSDPDTVPYGRFEVTYSFDPFKVSIPEDIVKASAKLAGVLLLDF